MVKIFAKGKSFAMGSDGPAARADEKPPMQVSFSYNFWMDKHEVTQRAYDSATIKHPVLPSSPYGVGDDYPIYNVSFYDAVYHCNEMSQINGMDTVYTYQRLDMTAEGVIYKMENLQAHFEREGYRLPTEAEWEYAALAGSAGTYFWGSDDSKADTYASWSGNSGGKTHPVGEREPNAFGLYDMAGNVMEWTSDWKGPYADVQVENFLGSLQPNTLAERPVKGGSFLHGRSYLRPSNRSATYSTISSQTAEYVGFRTVIGVIPKGNHLDGSGAVSQSYPADLILSRGAVKQLFDTYNTRMCFVNRNGETRNLCFVDFRAGEPRIQEFFDGLAVFNPRISPDGQYAVFSTQGEGSGLPSSLYLRSLGPGADGPVKLGEGVLPNWWPEPVSGDTFIVYASSGVDNKQAAEWNATQTLRQKISGGAASGLPEVLVQNGSFHSGIDFAGNRLASGFTRLLVHDLGNNQTQTLFQSPENGKDADGSSQVCNLSVFQAAGADRMVFLDFGYPRVSGIVGSAYGIHEYIFLSGMDGRGIQAIGKPDGEDAWDHPEWSNHPDFLVSSSTTASGTHESIYIVKADGSQKIRTISGPDVLHPDLWIGPALRNPEGLNLDSLGHYIEPSISGLQQEWAGKMKYFWNYHGSWDGVVLGSSRAASGVNPAFMPHYGVINLSYAGADIKGIDLMIREYVMPHAPQTRFIITTLMIGWLWSPGGDYSWSANMAPTAGFQYDLSNNFWKEAVPQNFDSLVLSAPYPFDDKQTETGFTRYASLGWGEPDLTDLTGGKPADDPDLLANLRRLDSLAVFLQAAGVHLFVINFPQSPAYADVPHYGRYGPADKNIARAVISRVEEMAAANSHLHFYDANLFGGHDYTDEEALNFDHLCELGAEKMSRRLDSLLMTIIP